jgi:hypothetical protein
MVLATDASPLIRVHSDHHHQKIPSLTASSSPIDPSACSASPPSIHPSSQFVCVANFAEKGKVTRIQRRWNILLKLGTTIIRARECTLAMGIAAPSIARTAGLTFSRRAAILLFRGYIDIASHGNCRFVTRSEALYSSCAAKALSVGYPFCRRRRRRRRRRTFTTRAVPWGTPSIPNRRSSSYAGTLPAAKIHLAGCPFPSRPRRNATP